MYPARWFQLGINLPPDYGSYPYIYPVMPLQFVYDRPLPAAYNAAYLWMDITTWMQSWIPNIIYGPTATEITFNFYLNRPSGLQSFQNVSTAIFNRTGPCLPLRKCVVVRMHTGSTSRRENGRKFFCGVREAFVRKDLLTSGGHLQYGLAMQNFIAPIVSQGVTYQMVVASFANGAAYPITSTVVNYRLGTIMRRGKPRGGYGTGLPYAVPT